MSERDDEVLDYEDEFDVSADSDDELDLDLDGPSAVSEDELIDRFIEEFDATVLDDDQGEPR